LYDIFNDLITSNKTQICKVKNTQEHN